MVHGVAMHVESSKIFLAQRRAVTYRLDMANTGNKKTAAELLAMIDSIGWASARAEETGDCALIMALADARKAVGKAYDVARGADLATGCVL